MHGEFQIGDLVKFDTSHVLGIVLDVKRLDELSDCDKEIYDVLVQWIDGEVFWCMDFTLEHVSGNSN